MTAQRAASPGAALEAVVWPFEQAGAALEALTHAARLRPEPDEPRAPAIAPARVWLAKAEARRQWMAALTRKQGVDAQAVRASPADLATLLTAGAPALFQLWLEPREPNALPHLIAVVAQARGDVVALTSTGARVRLRTQALVSALLAPLEAPAREQVNALLDAARIPKAQRARAERALIDDRLADDTLEVGWLLRPREHGAWSGNEKRSTARALGLLLAGHLFNYTLWAFAWQQVGRGALEGTLDPGRLAAGLLALLTSVPLQASLTWLGARSSLAAGAWLRRRLLGGLVAQGSEAQRGAGLGQLLGRVLEAGSVETLGLGSVLQTALGALDIVGTLLVLAHGACAGPLLALFLAALALVGLLARKLYARRALWTGSRIALSNDLVERMVGQRTRVVQENPARWHSEEDVQLETHLEHARSLDDVGVWLALAPRIWLAAACAFISLGVLPTRSAAGVDLGLAFAGILLGHRALAAVSVALAQITGAVIAWRNVAPFVCAPVRSSETENPLLALAWADRPEASLETHDLAVAPPSAAPLLELSEFQVHPRDRLLLSGPSGSGKSTLLRALARLAPPVRGLMLLGGLDAATLGETAWRRRVNLVPQFHDNHVFSGTLAFNVLLGRSWPPHADDLAEAERVCQELGLGALLERMPLGLHEIVGETGWQLSHGERSRVFAARAVLAEPDVMLLDESLSALDPETAMQVLDCVERRGRAVILVAHG